MVHCSLLNLAVACGLVLASPVSVSGLVSADAQTSFLSKCAASDVVGLKDILSSASTPLSAVDLRALLTTPSKEQETCLHLLGISGDPDALSYVLSVVTAHDDASDSLARSVLNARVGTPSGLDMPVLSWHVFGGHDANVALLRDFAARKGGSGNSKDVSLLDFDAVFKDERGKEITAMDVAEGILKGNNNVGERFKNIRETLRSVSARTREQLRVNASWTASVRSIEYKATTTDEAEGPASYHNHQVQHFIGGAKTVKKHQPVIIVSGGLGQVFVNGEEANDEGKRPSKLHPMTEEHFIQAVYVMDKKDNIVYYEELQGGEQAGSKTFPVEEGQELTPYEYCNKHGLWEGAKVTVSGFGGEL